MSEDDSHDGVEDDEFETEFDEVEPEEDDFDDTDEVEEDFDDEEDVDDDEEYELPTAEPDDDDVVEEDGDGIVPAIASLFVPGLGQVLNGDVGKGVVLFGLTVFSALLIFVGVGLFTTPIIAILAAYDAYKNA